ncbi:TonB-dependent receptor [Reichenbachiella sp. MALMAid0571]|uniref:SusC/RagA family TonB-linked outer membrane protein n=1 Tax=Reichenbachiella sp. MALMAid0571 TaxID=3143939 RepID=UPI0032DF9763
MSKRSLHALIVNCLLMSTIYADGLKAQTSIQSVKKASINIEFEDFNLTQLIGEIEAITDYEFSYNREDLDRKFRFSGKFRGTTVADLLVETSKQTNLKFRQVNNIIHISKKSTLSKKEEALEVIIADVEISGKITDENGEGLPGASVVVKGTATGTTSDIEGSYKLNVPEEVILTVSFVGYKTQEVTLNGRNVLDVQMELDAEQLEEVVVVGYGEQKRVNVTGSLATVKSEELTKTPSTNNTAMLAGRMPGLIVHQTNGQPGNDEANIRIRGFGNALVIVDGVQRDFTQLDPNEIESISILKDAAAAIYGSRAGNGVILVTTKRGIKGTPEININSSISNSRSTFFPDYVDGYQFATMYNRAQAQDGVTDLKYSQEDLLKLQEGTESGYINPNWQKKVMRDWAPQSQHNLNVRGGSDNSRYFFSVGYLDQGSIWKSGDGVYQRYNLASNIDTDISENLTAGLDFNFRREDRDNLFSQDEVFNDLLFADPTVDVDNFPYTDLILDMAPLRSGTDNAIGSSTQDISGYTRSKTDVLNVALSLKYKLPLKGLSIDGKMALRSLNMNLTKLGIPFEVHGYDYQSETLLPTSTIGSSSLTKSSTETQRITTQLALRYSREFRNHKISALLLNERINEEMKSFQTTSRNLLSSSIPYLDNADGTTATNTDDASQDGRVSWVGRANYSYKGKYLVEGTFRYDASPRFPQDTRWGFFPGISLAWRMSDEAFLQNSNVLSNLKLRASASKVGNDGTSSYNYLTGYGVVSGSNSTYVLNGNSYPRIQSTGLANKNITWEEVSVYNLGMESSFFNGIIGLEVDLFYRKRTGLLTTSNATLPNTFGATLPQQNINSQDNRGFELVLNHRNAIGGFRYNISGNVTLTRAKWIHFEEREFDEGDDQRINKQSGQWANRTFGYLTEGFFKSQDEIDAATIDYDQSGNVSLSPGDIKYVDTNMDGVITGDDRVELGKGTTPELMFGLNAEATFKGFDFSMLWQGASNYVTIFTGANLGGFQSGAGIPLTYQWEYQWNEENPNAAKLPAANFSGISNYNNRQSDISVQDATYLRLKNVSIGYVIPKSLLDKVGIKKVRVYASGMNVFTFSGLGIFKDYDPEISSSNAQSTYPIQKTYSLGINITL